MKDDDLNDFRQQCERSLQRSVEERMRYGFCYVYKPVMDDAPWRSFDSTAAYRKWCRKNLPEYLGYGEPDSLQQRILDGESPLEFFGEFMRRRAGHFENTCSPRCACLTMRPL